MQKLTSKLRKAVEDYNMIQEGDKIAVGLSGGKDSMALLVCLENLKRFYPKKFDILAITINLGFEEFDINTLKNFCENNKIKYIAYNTQISEIVFDVRKEKNPCSLCANLRRGALNDIAKKNSCNKIALGHHLDDVIETFLLSLIYESRISTFSPITYLSRADIKVIRPMIYIKESEIKGMIKRENFPTVNNPCPMDTKSKREDIKKLIKEISKMNPNIKTNIFNAIKRNIENWKI